MADPCIAPAKRGLYGACCYRKIIRLRAGGEVNIVSPVEYHFAPGVITVIASGTISPVRSHVFTAYVHAIIVDATHFNRTQQCTPVGA